jgi:hypothetical protein
MKKFLISSKIERRNTNYKKLECIVKERADVAEWSSLNENKIMRRP